MKKRNNSKKNFEQKVSFPVGEYHTQEVIDSMKQRFIHRVLLFFIPIALIVYEILSNLSSLLTTKITYEHLLAVLSFFMLSCGLINLIGHEPYTIHLIFVGIAGLFLSVAVPITQLIKLGFLLLFAYFKKEKVS